ncbi:kinesin family member 4/7/21/27 [Pseudohyphozyma bogoriensis]|nr:kinesin family member 4/7/21/27 [Pseudohyphozyma bogoriensis]
MASGRNTPSSMLASPPVRRESLSAASTPLNSTSVKVVVRIRPSSSADHSAQVPTRFQRTVVYPLNATTLQIEGPPATHAGATTASASLSAKNGNKQTFTFDRVIAPDEGQSQVYECAESLVDSFMDGFNTTILAYGQTSSGKSYTMGTDRYDEDADEERMGITPRAVSSIFDRMRDITAATKGGTTFNAKVSYVEIYNEDLIDLLAGDADVKPMVQIREDKAGNIIWSGLREVKVFSAADVMNNLAAGSALRQTSSTDMNAQSSRSHAIFSLTLTQRKYTGTGSPPSPQAGTRVRASGLPRVTSPTPGSRSGTPTGDRPGSRFGLRPPSQIGRPSSPNPQDERENGGVESWTTVTSKFHFVDLAGSERLKRTSALGDRAKEGISINSGLHALGNVISALGDPAKKSTHIPYRDSKLTRLLQDSLGGNSRTMMVACCSPTEFNRDETISTVKYANRAKNIKNRAEINEVEVGWDDVDYLQKTILRLRGELALVKSGGGGGGGGGEGLGMGPIAEEGDKSDASRELQERYSHLGPDLDKSQDGSVRAYSKEDFAAAIEPIVEEYEKSLSALESQLSLTRAALGHSEEEMRELEAKIEEEARTNEASTSIIGDLKTRISKLTEREATTEAYVRDLEAKLKDYGDQDESYGSAVSDLRKEITKNREQAESTEQYIKELEGRLAQSDEAQSGLKRQIEVLERDVERREEAYRDLESRLSLLDTSGEHKVLLAEIDERDKRLLELERTLDDLKTQHSTAEQEAARLQKIAAVEKEAKEELQSRVRTLERASMSSKIRPVSYTPPQSPAHAPGEGEDKTPPVDSAVVSGLELRLDELQATHERTLAELDIANAKYRDSLKEIAELSSNVQEAKSIQASDSDVAPSPTSATSIVTPSAEDGELEVLNDVASPPSSPSLSTTYEQMKSEVMKLQSVLAEREEEITVLEASLHQLRGGSQTPLMSLTPDPSANPSSTSPPTPRIVTNGTFTPPDVDAETAPDMTPQTMAAFEALKAELLPAEAPDGEHGKTDEVRLDNLMRSMAKKESHHHETVSDLEDQLSTLRRQHDELTVLSRDQVTNMSTEIERLRTALEGRPEASHYEDRIKSMEGELEAKNAELVKSREAADGDLTSAKTALEGEHQRAVEALIADHVASLERLRKEHAEVLREHLTKSEELAKQAEAIQAEHQSQLETIRQEHATALDTQSSSHAEEIQSQSKETESKLATLVAEHAAAIDTLTRQSEEARQVLTDDHSAKLEQITGEHTTAIEALQVGRETALSEQVEAHKVALTEASQKADEERAEHVKSLEEKHQEALSSLNSEHNDAVSSLMSSHQTNVDTLKEEHAQALSAQVTSHETTVEELKAKHDEQLKAALSERDTIQSSHQELTAAHAVLTTQHEGVTAELSKVRTDQEGLLEQFGALHENHDKEVSGLQASLAEATAKAEANAENPELETTKKELQEAHDALSTLEKALVESQEERERLVTQLKESSQSAEEAAEVAKEVERLKASTAKLEEELASTREERDNLSAQIARLSNGSDGTNPATLERAMSPNGLERAMSPTPSGLERAMSPTGEGRGTPPRANGILPNGKVPPPPTPPPSMPPPPPPMALPALPGLPSSRVARSSSSGSINTAAGTSRNSNLSESTAGTSIRPQSTTDSIMETRVSKKLEEQEAQIARLTKQLSHCESDLQANIDLVNTLESALNDSERNLRKARQQMGDLARERDTFLGQNDTLRREIQEAHSEVETVRHSVIQVESRLQSERREKDEARRQLESRLRDVNTSSKSKFNCF